MEQIQRLNSQLELRNRLLQETFGRYLSDEIVHTLLESPDGLALGGKKRFITVLMTDLRGFTLISEQMDVEAVVCMLNHYFSEMVDIIHKHNGTVIEFIGDAVLAIFGAPVEDENHADEAVACAVEMQLIMESVNACKSEVHVVKSMQVQSKGVNTYWLTSGIADSRSLDMAIRWL
jgi:adenylate cyclase